MSRCTSHVFTAQIGNRHPALRLAQHAHDLGFSETALLHWNLLVHLAEKILHSHHFNHGQVYQLTSTHFKLNHLSRVYMHRCSLGHYLDVRSSFGSRHASDLSEILHIMNFPLGASNEFAFHHRRVITAPILVLLIHNVHSSDHAIQVKYFVSYFLTLLSRTVFNPIYRESDFQPIKILNPLQIKTF